MISGLMLDVRIAARNLRRRPSFGVTVLVTLALGLGATTAMFSVVNGVLLRPLPYHEPGQLVSIYTSFPEWKGKPVVGDIWNRLRTPYPEYAAAVAGQRTFEQIAGFQVSLAPLTIGQETISAGLGSATANLLPLLGVRPALGRWFLPGEDGPGAMRLTLLSDGLWRTRFGGDSSVLGRTVIIDEQPFTIVGVLPAGFALTAREVEANGARTPDLWVPVGADPQTIEPGNHTLELIGRLRDGVSPPQALADIEPFLRDARARDRRSASLEPRADVEVAEVRRPILLLLGAVGLLLVITCINVAMLFLGECATRQRELNTRHMLGASRSRLIRLLFVESTTIAIIGAFAGSLVAWWGTRLMLGLAPI